VPFLEEFKALDQQSISISYHNSVLLPTVRGVECNRQVGLVGQTMHFDPPIFLNCIWKTDSVAYYSVKLLPQDGIFWS